jgi:hypothetical protein
MGINDFREKIIVGEKNYCRGLNHCAGVGKLNEKQFTIEFCLLHYTGCPIGIVHGFHINMAESIGHIEPKNRVNMKAILSGRLLTYWPTL